MPVLKLKFLLNLHVSQSIPLARLYFAHDRTNGVLDFYNLAISRSFTSYLNLIFISAHCKANNRYLTISHNVLSLSSYHILLSATTGLASCHLIRYSLLLWNLECIVPCARAGSSISALAPQLSFVSLRLFNLNYYFCIAFLPLAYWHWHVIPCRLVNITYLCIVHIDIFPLPVLLVQNVWSSSFSIDLIKLFFARKLSWSDFWRLPFYFTIIVIFQNLFKQKACPRLK